MQHSRCGYERFNLFSPLLNQNIIKTCTKIAFQSVLVAYRPTLRQSLLILICAIAANVYTKYWRHLWPDFLPDIVLYVTRAVVDHTDRIQKPLPVLAGCQVLDDMTLSRFITI